MRLTRKRIRELEVALSIDDVLYEKFRRLSENLAKQEERFRRSKRVLRVLQKRNNMMVALPILEVRKSSEGMQVIVG